MKTRSLVLALAVALLAAPATAQTPENAAQAPESAGPALADASRRIAWGDTVVVTDRTGRTTRGTLLVLSATSIKLACPAVREIPIDQILRIDKRGDSLSDGFKRGAIAGAALGVFRALQVKGPYGLMNIHTQAIEFGLLGLLVDAIHRGRTTVYRAPGNSAGLTVAPLGGRGRHGMAVSLKF
jgi:hypothetical protein